MALEPDDPDWSIWSKADAVELQDAVALALDIGPGGQRHQLAKNGGKLFRHADPGRDHYHEWLRLSLSHLGRDLPLADPSLALGPPTETSKVRLKDFAAFAARMGWELDDHFPWKELSYIDENGNKVTLVNVDGKQMVRTPFGEYISQEEFRALTTPHHEPIPPEVAIAASIKEAVSSNVSVVRLVPTSKPKPDWEYWVSIPDTTIINAVALSCDVEPNVFANEFIGVGADPSSEMHQFWKRTLVASANAVNGALKRVRSNPGTTLLPPCIFDDVSLVEFSTWAEGLPYPWELPKDFPRTRKGEQPLRVEATSVANQAPPAPQEPTPLGKSEAQSERMAAHVEAEPEPRESTRVTLLMIIAGAIGDGIESQSTAAKTIERRLEKWGIDSPKHRQILNWLNEAKQVLDKRKAKS